MFVGKINAVTGKKMDEVDKGAADEPVQDYVVVPGQDWLDGICIAPGIVRQFVAMPCKSRPLFPSKICSTKLMRGPKWALDKPLKVKKPAKRNTAVSRLKLSQRSRPA